MSHPLSKRNVQFGLALLAKVLIWSLIIAPDTHTSTMLPDVALVALNHHYVDI